MKLVCGEGHADGDMALQRGHGQTAPDFNHAHKVHPAMMPLKLAQDLIRTYSNEDDLVLDPFAGSGTTLYAAKFLKRQGRWHGDQRGICEPDDR